MNSDMTSRNHLRRITVLKVSKQFRKGQGRVGKDLRIIVDLNLGKHGNILGSETKRDVSARVTRGTLDTLPVLDLGHDDVDTLAEEVVHVFSIQLSSETDILSLPNAEASDALPGLVCGGADVCDCLDDHTGNVEM